MTFAAQAARWLLPAEDVALRSGSLALPRSHHQRVLQALTHSEEELWRRRTVVWPARYLERLSASNAKIIAVANLTGGAGKATLAANLAAHFAIGRGLKVLVLDMDADGALGETLLKAARAPRPPTSLDQWLVGDADPRRLVDRAASLKSIMPAARLVMSADSFAELEGRLSRQWIMGARSEDGRYVLAEKLLSRAVQSKFDIVVVNAPSRLSLGAINALTAATHLVVPTAVDRVSCKAAATLAQLVQSLRPALFPQLSLLGFAFMPEGERMSFEEQCGVVGLKQVLEGMGVTSGAHMFVRSVPPTSAAEPGRMLIRRPQRTGLDYLDDADRRARFAELADAIAARAGIYCSI